MRPGFWRIGARAEARAARWLRAQGFRILGRNLRAGPGEIDVLAMEGPVLAVVEIRVRAAGVLAADLSITPAKVDLLERTLQALRHRHPRLRDIPLRGDLLVLEPDGTPHLLRGLLGLRG